MGRPTKENSLTKQDVIAAAIACLEKEGESALGVNRVARELNIKPPAIYPRFQAENLQRNLELVQRIEQMAVEKGVKWFKFPKSLLPVAKS